jgi:SSS family solute:Na+ symporter
MLLGFLILGFFYTLVSVLWGFAALVRFPNLQSADLASPALLGSELVPPVIAVIMIVGILAAAITTIDSILLTLSSMVARDVYGTHAGVEESRQLAVGKIVIPVIAILALLFAGLRLDLIAVLAVSSSAGLLVTVPAIVGAFFWRHGGRSSVEHPRRWPAGGVPGDLPDEAARPSFGCVGPAGLRGPLRGHQPANQGPGAQGRGVPRLPARRPQG